MHTHAHTGKLFDDNPLEHLMQVRVWGLGLGFRVLGFRVWVLGFRV